MKRTIVTILAAGTALLGVAACSSDADVASHNLSKAADNFEVQRRIVFYNGITDKYILEVVGLCSIGNDDPARYVSITCKVGPDKYVKNFFFKSDNTTVWSEQLQSNDVSTDHYRVVFKPESVVPQFDLRTGKGDD